MKIRLMCLFSIAFSTSATAHEMPDIDPLVSKDFLMGHFDPKVHADFVKIDPSYASRSNLYLQVKAYEAFKAMSAAAKKAGIRLVIKSATRNFDYQRGIWDGKWIKQQNISDPVRRALSILEYSSMPGSSRHHWGTDIDLNDFNNRYFESGRGKKEFTWLRQNAPQFGFCQPYTAKGEARPDGYNEEKWHWSYKPLSKHYTSQAALQLDDSDLQGFKGAEVAGKIGVIARYVLGVSDECR